MNTNAWASKRKRGAAGSIPVRNTNMEKDVKKWLRKWLGFDDEVERLYNRISYLERKIKEQKRIIADQITDLQRLTRMDLDVGYRGPNTVILTGVFQGKGYIRFYDVPHPVFERYVMMFKEQAGGGGSLIRNIDAPPSFGPFPGFLLKD